jgi:hypothetical protein
MSLYVHDYAAASLPSLVVEAHEQESHNRTENAYVVPVEKRRHTVRYSSWNDLHLVATKQRHAAVGLVGCGASAVACKLLSTNSVATPRKECFDEAIRKLP